MTEDTPRYCKDCKHYKHTPEKLFEIPFYGQIKRQEKHECFRRISLITGTPVPVNCEDERDDSLRLKCSDVGLFFEPKDSPKDDGVSTASH